ncbi:alpha/beta fold hydrolase [Pseudoalteromonas sp. NZS37]
MNKQKFGNNLLTIFGKSTPPSKQVVDTLWELLIYKDGLAVMPKLISYIKQRQQNRERWVGAIINSNIPLTFIAGAEDPISGKYMIEHYKKLIPNARVQEFVELGHYPQVENPDAITQAYLNFRYCK